ncbi:GrpB family protein [uncultured Muribaculum sp.]|uniref:GrpB family protein n=1 Tax=uncultured Muribaculum sp. TaxID=1918613 RepID=UPI0025AF6339|nr:GrpB family protein [uncultured Muribaculum sp.]
MAKSLNDMTLGELWQLFPIILSSHRPQWEDWAKEEIESLLEILSEYFPIINHIGSTAVPNIQAKPIIDILVELSLDYNWQDIRAIMDSSGYICMSLSPNRMSFNKGYSPDGYAEKVYHIHFHAVGDNDEIYFRDYLKNNPSIASEYESLKLSLLPRYRNNRDGYTEAKSDFVRRVTEQAKRQK